MINPPFQPTVAEQDGGYHSLMSMSPAGVDIFCSFGNKKCPPLPHAYSSHFMAFCSFSHLILDPCKAVKCREMETCKVEEDHATCIPNFIQSCWGWGDPHYHTFDGLDFDFQGTCTYTIAKYCGNDSTLVPFTIEEKNENRGNQAVSYVRLANIYVYGHKISIHKQETGRIRVCPLIRGEKSDPGIVMEIILVCSHCESAALS